MNTLEFKDFIISMTVIAAAAALQLPRLKINPLIRRLLSAFCFAVPLVEYISREQRPELDLFGFSLDFGFLLLTAIISVGLIILNLFTAGSSNNLAVYPQIRQYVWTPALVCKSLITWVAYIVLYELTFRGIFLGASVHLLGLTMGLVVNVVVYSLAHFLKNKREGLVTVPFGIFLCYVTWTSQTVWYAVAIHALFAVSHEISSIRAHPQMKFSFSTKRN